LTETLMCHPRQWGIFSVTVAEMSENSVLRIEWEPPTSPEPEVLLLIFI